jgi:cell wall-associated NlpC family hydrolase
MQIQQRHKLVATPEGIFWDGMPLHKCDLGKFSERALRHIYHATAIYDGLTSEDWKQTVPPRTIEPRALMDTSVAMANAYLFEETNSNLLNKDSSCTNGAHEGWINELRDYLGRWARWVSGGAGKTSQKRFLTECEAKKIAHVAQSFADKKVPYVYGGENDKGADCSGSTFYIYNKAGFPYSPRGSVKDFVVDAKDGKIPFDEIPNASSPQIGDVIVFQGEKHMAIYAGQDKNGNDLMWTASSGANAYVQQRVKFFSVNGVHVPVKAYYRYQTTDD